MKETRPAANEFEANFDWQIYADATFAGLAVLIPLPIVDAIFEGIFRRRMATTIARRRGIEIDPTRLRQLEREGCSPVGCLLWPFKQSVKLLGKISRKILYFLTIKEAGDMLSYYWHRAFLLDYMLGNSALSDEAPPAVARQALARTLRETGTGPLSQLAAQVVGNSHHALRSLWRVIRRRRDSEIDDHRAVMGKRWDEYQDYWRKLARRFDAVYAAELSAFRRLEAAAAQPPPVAAPGAERGDDPEPPPAATT